MKIKAIVSDFDGTIVSYEQMISNVVKDSIKVYIKSGGIFSVATGRAYEGLLQNTCHELGIQTPQIVRGGSEIILAKTDEVIWGKYIDPIQVDLILQKLLILEEFITLAESGKDLFTKNGQTNKEFATGAIVKDIKDLPVSRVPKIAIPPLYDLERIEPIIKDLKESYPELHIVKTTSKHGYGIDINDGGAGKRSALFAYASIMKLNPEEIMGIGDSYNDLPLLSACGVKVAMGNAPLELKNVADFIVGTQANDGVAEAIELALK